MIESSLSEFDQAAAETPAAIACREEHAKVMMDKTHQHYAGYQRGEKAALDYVDSLYRKAYPGNRMIEIGGGLIASSPPSEQLGDPVPTSTDPQSEQAQLDEQERMEMDDTKQHWANDGITLEQGIEEVRPLAELIASADPELYGLISRRLGDGVALRVLRIIKSRINL
ncbi:hypothetical protein W02_38250 [Nitrospira sp. KM1]|uniref:hypothetical protein n=1 Tax=Nitrospira sp. KM1 TaxID=1936990 RepID=UPI0013A70D17|nr:hypothetical protein [Nitrospira sp. KM1]BCA56685.1 hypothetical protein W02_38250 [Nitrospira sp. KM1]